MIGNLPLDTTKEELLSFFEAIGKVSRIEVLTDKNGKCRGFAFVTMADPAQKAKIVPKLDNTQFKDRILSVSDAKMMSQPKRTGFIAKMFGAK